MHHDVKVDPQFLPPWGVHKQFLRDSRRQEIPDLEREQENHDDGGGQGDGAAGGGLDTEVIQGLEIELVLSNW